MRLVTWNLNGLESASLDERTEAAVFVTVLGARLDQLHAGTTPGPPPDVICFQEVVRRTFDAHLLPHLGAGGYTVLPAAAPERETFEVLAFRSAAYTLTGQCAERLAGTRLGRVLTVVDLAAGPASGQVHQRVVTAHCDSGADAAAIRVEQLRQIDAALASAPDPGAAVFAGDANLRKAEWAGVRESLRMRDAWEELGEPATTRYTWRRDDYKARFDRVFLGEAMRVHHMDPLGDLPLPRIEVPVSDHIGLAVTVTPRAA